MIPSELQ